MLKDTQRHSGNMHSLKDISKIFTRDLEILHFLQDIQSYPKLPKATQAGLSVFRKVVIA